ncbi:Uncharacterised protein [Mycobacteroides abscessus subsp. abscessus]|nr:Uncharacterised protein [Mycobacteroides abscessus subsp. abscessus]
MSAAMTRRWSTSPSVCAKSAASTSAVCPAENELSTSQLPAGIADDASAGSGAGCHWVSNSFCSNGSGTVWLCTRRR